MEFVETADLYNLQLFSHTFFGASAILEQIHEFKNPQNLFLICKLSPHIQIESCVKKKTSQTSVTKAASKRR